MLRSSVGSLSDFLRARGFGEFGGTLVVGGTWLWWFDVKVRSCLMWHCGRFSCWKLTAVHRLLFVTSIVVRTVSRRGNWRKSELSETIL